jgi:hypothetical protein
MFAAEGATRDDALAHLRDLLETHPEMDSEPASLEVSPGTIRLWSGGFPFHPEMLLELLEFRFPELAREIVDRKMRPLVQEIEELKKAVGEKKSNPWLAMAGMFKDDPLFDEWQAAIAEYRREQEKEDQNAK